MDTVSIIRNRPLGGNFVPAEYLRDGENEYTVRNEQTHSLEGSWRNLYAGEIETLIENGNTADDWDEIFVSEPFDPNLILNTSFYGLVRFGTMEEAILEHHDLQLPVGITNSKIVSCDVGNHVAIHNVHYLAHYIIGDRSILTNVDEMHTSNHAKFGNGVIKAGEDESIRVRLDIINETGSRSVVPFDGMITADAYLWARYRDDTELQRRLLEMTQNRLDSRRGYYGTVGNQTVIKNSRIIKDVKFGSHAYIKGANKLKNLTINSRAEEPTQVGEGVELVNGIIGYGCRIFYGCKAIRFIMGSNCSLKYGARLINSFMGDNSTVSCCELLNNLIFPAHEQHHNNSFLVAGLLMGQSNIAAGATIGSNHNSRANDNEIQAGRGFWPGLCTSLKHSSRFASYVLVAKGSYPAELDIPLPFSLVNNNVAENRLEVMPAYWWLYNMYALARNTWKYAARDNRKTRLQHIEFDSLAPDTVEEILQARRLLREWGLGECEEPLEVTGLEKSKRPTMILKPRKADEAYAQMLHYYAAVTLLRYLEEGGGRTLSSLQAGSTNWVNLGGQLVPMEAVDELRRDIREGSIRSWDDVHSRYDELWTTYADRKAEHAFGVLTGLLDNPTPTEEAWRSFLTKAVKIQELIRDRVFESRQKDYENPFRIATYRNRDEMTAALGTIDDNSFVLQVREETEEFRSRVDEYVRRPSP